jgi:DNA-directed RNA polymerase subunit RPC12/RpoP
MSTAKKTETIYYLASRCPSCGGAKTRPSQSAYVYCDYCGSLCDYDFRKACEQAKSLPGPVYEKLSMAVQAQCEKALQSNDREKYLEAQSRLFDAWVDACPNAVPVRVKDADFRKQYVAHLAECATVVAFDAESKRISAEMTAVVGKLQWRQEGTNMRVSGKSFTPLIELVLVSVARTYSDDLLSQYSAHPDGAGTELLKRVASALFVQGWLPYLDAATAKTLLEKTCLAQEYLSKEAQTMAEWNCGHCNNTVPVFAGAKLCVCEQCGHKLALEQGIRCDGCGSTLAIDVASHGFYCPHCQRKLEKIGGLWPGAFILS